MYRTNCVRAGIRFAIVLTLMTSAADANAGEKAALAPWNATAFAAPADPELLAAYQRDRSNQKVQSWSQYRGWVHTFYDGNLMSEGWSKFGEVTAGKVKSAAARQAVINEIRELGNLISREWAKDSSVSKITTTDLRRWNDVMSAARQRDDGSGREIIEALRTVRTMAERVQ